MRDCDNIWPNRKRTSQEARICMEQLIYAIILEQLLDCCIYKNSRNYGCQLAPAPTHRPSLKTSLHHAHVCPSMNFKQVENHKVTLKDMNFIWLGPIIKRRWRKSKLGHAREEYWSTKKKLSKTKSRIFTRI